MTPARRRELCLALALTAITLPADAHDRIRAVVTLDRAKPVVDEPATIAVRFETLTGVPQQMREYRVRVVASMAGHAMRPVEAPLAADRATNQFRGHVAFTMAGPWQVAIRAESDHDAIAGTMPVEVLFEPEPAAPGGAPTPVPTLAIDMQTPEPETPVSPWWIVGATLFLVVLLEGAAIGRKVRDAREAARGENDRLSSAEGLRF